MSIDEVMLVAEDYSMAVHDGRDADCGRLHKALRAAIKQHVAEEVAREREELLDLVDSYAKDNADLKDAVRARAEKDVP